MTTGFRSAQCRGPRLWTDTVGKDADLAGMESPGLHPRVPCSIETPKQQLLIPYMGKATVTDYSLQILYFKTSVLKSGKHGNYFVVGTVAWHSTSSAPSNEPVLPSGTPPCLTKGTRFRFLLPLGFCLLGPSSRRPSTNKQDSHLSRNGRRAHRENQSGALLL